MKAKLKETGEVIDLAEEGIIARDGRRFAWYQVDLIPEPMDRFCYPAKPMEKKEYPDNLFQWLVWLGLGFAFGFMVASFIP